MSFYISLKVISKGFDFVKLNQTLMKETDCRKPCKIIMTGSGDSLICNLDFYLMNIHKFHYDVIEAHWKVLNIFQTNI